MVVSRAGEDGTIYECSIWDGTEDATDKVLHVQTVTGNHETRSFLVSWRAMESELHLVQRSYKL